MIVASSTISLTRSNVGAGGAGPGRAGVGSPHRSDRPRAAPRTETEAAPPSASASASPLTRRFARTSLRGSTRRPSSTIAVPSRRSSTSITPLISRRRTRRRELRLPRSLRDGRAYCRRSHPKEFPYAPRDRPPSPRGDALPCRRRRVVRPVHHPVVHRESPGRGLRRPVGAIDPGRRSVLDGREWTGPPMSPDVVIGIVGVIVTILVVVGMILITPRGVETSNSPAPPAGVDDV